ncbi:MAG: hypothetical protein R3B93_10455 [Bacteroidia bacterium]
MKVTLFDRFIEEEINAEISQVYDWLLLPSEEENWNFTWQQLYKGHQESLFFQINLVSSSDQIEGLIMLSLQMNEMLFMHNIEIAPHNVGSKGRYRRVAGCLLAFSCSLSFNLGKGDYRGYLSFKSKTELIELYMKKYGARIAVGQNLFFNPEAGKELIKTYLNQSVNPNIK